MNETTFIKLIQYYRHDLMNHLQVISGYLSMNKKQKANEKIHEVIASFYKEQKLFQLQAPKLTIWLLQFNHTNENIRITYDIDMAKMDINKLDTLLVQLCNHWVHVFNMHSFNDELYYVHILLSSSPERVILTFTFKNHVNDKEQFFNDLSTNECNFEIIENENEITCSFYVSY